MARTTKAKEEKVDLTGIKEELRDYVNLSVKKAIKEELDKSNKRLIREKNKKILFRNIVILILLVIIGLLLFLMYKNRFFNKYLGCENNTVSNNTIINKKTEKEEINEVTLDELITEFSYLLDNVTLHEDSTYIHDYYGGKLSNELKSYLAFNNLEIDALGVEEDYNLFDSSLLKFEYNKLFDGPFEGVSFNYLGEKVRYLDKMDSYITDKVLVRKPSNIKREIVDIKVDGKTTIFTCVEGVVKDNHLYNVLNKKEIKYNSDKLSDYQKSLTKVVYTFENGKLSSIE